MTHPFLNRLAATVWPKMELLGNYLGFFEQLFGVADLGVDEQCPGVIL